MDRLKGTLDTLRRKLKTDTKNYSEFRKAQTFKVLEDKVKVKAPGN